MTRVPDAATPPERLAEQLGSCADYLVVIDFDGTLASIVDHPDLAAPVTGAVQAVAALAERTDVVVLSGRPVADLRRRFGELDGVTYAGGHGAEVMLPDGTTTALIDASSVDEPLDRIEEIIRGLVDDEAGWLVERKPTSLAVHHRLASEERVDELLPRVQAVMEHEAQEPPGFSVLHGKAVVELRPATVTKGRAVEWLAARTPGLKPLAIGDDITDEDAFVTALEHGGEAVLVADEPRDTVATHHLADPDEVTEFLVAFSRSGV